MSLLLLFVSQQETTEPGDCDLLTESGGSLLQENGDALLLEGCGEIPPTTTGGKRRRSTVTAYALPFNEDDELIVWIQTTRPDPLRRH